MTSTGRVVLHLRTPTGPQTFKATTFAAVDCMTDRDDLAGGLTCGPLKEPLGVYLLAQGVAPVARQAVAIEFLPK